MVATILLIIIYLAFISLGLPDTLLGVAIPSIQEEWNAPLAANGLLATAFVLGGVISIAMNHLYSKKNQYRHHCMY